MIDVSRETMADLVAFQDLLSKWNAKINLVSSMDDLWDRHILDSLQLGTLIPSSAKCLVDFGSGGGFPAVVLAVYAKIALPHLHLTMIESDQRKSAFLRACIRELDINAKVVSERIEETPPLGADVITARATASLSKLLDWSEAHGGPNAICLFLKGQKSDDEILDAQRVWGFDVEKIPSQTHESGSILVITSVTSKQGQ